MPLADSRRIRGRQAVQRPRAMLLQPRHHPLGVSSIRLYIGANFGASNAPARRLTLDQEGSMVRLIVSALFLFWLVATPAPAAPALGAYNSAVGTPESTGRMQIQVTMVIKGKAVTKTVDIPKGDIKPFVQPAREAGEKFDDWVARVAEARGEASQAKAQVIADAINKAFGLKAPGPVVTTGVEIRKQAFFVVNKAGVSSRHTADITLGTFNIPNVVQKDAVKFIENKIKGEGGNSSKWIPNQPGNSRRMSGALERTVPGVVQLATGLDPLGSPSVVDFGLVGKYVADVAPTAGMTDAQVLQEMAMLLDHHGVDAAYDSATTALVIDNILPSQALDWGNTDTGLGFTTVMSAT
ncbi:MAG: hypothetical protein ACYC8V_16280, partial [Caulobacteraceae bacterium]